MNDVDDLDMMLTRLAGAPAPASLGGIETKVVARIAARPDVRAGIGVGAASPLSPLGPVSPLAPSILLAGAP